VINLVVLWVTTVLTDRIEIEGFWSYFWASLIISVATIILHAILPDRSYQHAGCSGTTRTVHATEIARASSSIGPVAPRDHGTCPCPSTMEEERCARRG
jgi:hypothetical protein